MPAHILEKKFASVHLLDPQVPLVLLLNYANTPHH